MSDASRQPFVEEQRDLTTPFSVELDGGTCECVEVLRWLPGKRLVARARYSERNVVVKLFIGRGAKRRFLREKAGVAHLLASRVRSPELIDASFLKKGFLKQGFLKNGSPNEVGRALIFDYVDATAVSVDARQAAEAVATALGGLHADGVVHRDLHLDNFMLAGDEVYVIDGDSVKKQRGPLGEAPSLGHLAVFLAQYPPSEAVAIERLLACYERARGWPPVADRLSRLRASVVVARQRRVHHFLAKTQRACTEFVRFGDWRSNVLARREVFDGPLRTFAEDPETHLADGEIIKAGNSATVFRLDLGGQRVIVKRYNVKNLWHRVRRWFKPRARVAWRNGQRLRFLGIPTADPLVLVERRWGPLRGLAYLVMADRGNQDLASQVASKGWQPAWLDAVAELFTDLRTAGLRHADTKATNFLVQDDRVYLIDLDGMTERRGARLGRAENVRRDAEDVRRFLANWQGEDLAVIEQRLRAAELA